MFGAIEFGTDVAELEARQRASLQPVVPATVTTAVETLTTPAAQTTMAILAIVVIGGGFLMMVRR